MYVKLNVSRDAVDSTHMHAELHMLDTIPNRELNLLLLVFKKKMLSDLLY